MRLAQSQLGKSDTGERVVVDLRSIVQRRQTRGAPKQEGPGLRAMRAEASSRPLKANEFWFRMMVLVALNERADSYHGTPCLVSRRNFRLANWHGGDPGVH
jgi:hypothetical protein